MDAKLQSAALASLNDELNGAYLYDALAQVERLLIIRVPGHVRGSEAEDEGHHPAN